MSARSVQMPGQTSGGGAAITVLQIPLQLVSEGLLFGSGTREPALADAADLDFLLVTPADIWVHFFPRATLGGDGLVAFFEDTTVSANGAAANILNRNRNSASVAGTTFFTGPTITGDGTQLAEVLLIGGEKKESVGSTSSIFEEIILKPASNYLLRVTNQSGGAAPASFAVTFYETPAPS